MTIRWGELYGKAAARRKRPTALPTAWLGRLSAASQAMEIGFAIRHGENRSENGGASRGHAAPEPAFPLGYPCVTLSDVPHIFDQPERVAFHALTNVGARHEPYI